jgi:FKBP-type peptidyl-prolyl cis-trans isomerase FkpA
MMKKYLLYMVLTAFAVNANAQEGFQKSTRGARYKILTNKPGERIKLNDIVTFNITQKNDKDSILNSTYKNGQPGQTQVKAEGDLMDILPKLTVGDSVWIKIPTDTIFFGHEEGRPPFLPKGSDLNTYVKIEKVQSLEDAMAEMKAAGAKAEAAENAMVDKYIADNHLAFTTTATGLKYKITQQGTKTKPAAGDSVYVNYTGRTLDGKVFDSSIESVAKAAGLQQPGRTYEPIAFPVGRGNVIMGWDQGLLLLNAGSKATFLIPSKLAYGPSGAGQDIKPYSPLLFDVELVKVKPAANARPANANKPGAKPAVKKPAAKATTAKKAVVTKKKQ